MTAKDTTHQSAQPLEPRERSARGIPDDGTRLGFAVNGGDSSQEGAAILVSDIHAARSELESRGVKIGNWRVDERDGKKPQVFFAAAPDGLCYYFHQPIEG